MTAAVGSPLHPQLQEVAEELLAALDRLHALRDAVPSEAWARRPDPARWSVAECVAHLNLTTAAYLPLLDSALAEARRLDRPAPRRYRRGLAGWLLWAIMGPAVRVRTRTIAAFIPESAADRDELVAEFERLQERLMAMVRSASGLPIQAVTITSPFDPRLRYNLFACLGILARHQHRHLWQAERAWSATPR